MIVKATDFSKETPEFPQEPIRTLSKPTASTRFSSPFLLHTLLAQKRKVGIKTGKPICCCCPETKKIRDLCMVEKGEEACADVIEAHKVCLRDEGFVVK